MTLEEKRKKVMVGRRPAGQEKRNGGLNPFKNLTKEDLIRVSKGHHLPVDGLL